MFLRPLRGAYLIPLALLVVADFSIVFMIFGLSRNSEMRWQINEFGSGNSEGGIIQPMDSLYSVCLVHILETTAYILPQTFVIYYA